MAMATRAYRILICDSVGLRAGPDGMPDISAVAAHIAARGGTLHLGDQAQWPTLPAGLHFFYQPQLSTAADILAVTQAGQYDAVIAAATFIPPEAQFGLGGVRIGAGTGNMGSRSWGGPNGVGGVAPLMNTPGFNARATAQMTFKALLHFRPDLDFATLQARVLAGQFDTGRDLQHFPTAKLEGQRIAVLGYGNIGREVAKLAAAFGLHVQVFARAHHHARISADGFMAHGEVLSAARGADVISIHTGLGVLDAATGRFNNAELIGADVLAALAPGATLLNFDRGECVDAGALDAALARGHVAHAAIDADIFTSSTSQISGPLAPYLPLAQKYGLRVLLLPHAAADTDHPSRVAGAKQAVDQIFDAVLHKRVVNRKGDLPPGYHDGGAKLGV